MQCVLYADMHGSLYFLYLLVYYGYKMVHDTQLNMDC